MLRSIGLTFLLFLVFLGPVLADEPAGSALKALNTLLAEIGAGSDDAFDVYKQRAKITTDAIAPSGLRPLLEQSDILFNDLKVAVSCREGILEVSWKTEGLVDKSIDEAEKVALDRLKPSNLEPTTDQPKRREAEAQLRMIQLMSQRVTTLTRQSGGAQEFVVVGLADRNARPGSRVRVMLQWTAAARFDGPALTFQEAMDHLPMLKNVPIEAEILKTMQVAVLGQFETGLQDRAARTDRSARFLFSGDHWSLSTGTDVRPEFQEAVTASGYSLEPERAPQAEPPEGYESMRWRHDKARNLVGWMYSFSPLQKQNMLHLGGQAPSMAGVRPQ